MTTRFFPGAGTARTSDSILSLDEGEQGIWVVELLGQETPDNRMTPAMLQAYQAALQHVLDASDTFPQGGALITTGCRDTSSRSSKYFSNGLDYMRAVEMGPSFAELYNAVMTTLLSFPVPTIAALNGHAYAGAFVLSLAHDVRVMNESRGWMCMNEAHFGAPIGSSSTAILQAKLPPKLVADIVLRARRFTGPEALEAGLVDEVAPPENVVDAALAQARALRPVSRAHRVWGRNRELLTQAALQALAEPPSGFGLIDAAMAEQISKL